MKYYRLISLIFALTFGIVGFIFLLFPEGAFRLFNWLSGYMGMVKSPVGFGDFYLILAVGYMYLVTILAFKMYQYPENKIFPFLLANGKLTSSVISLYFFVFHAQYLIYISNFIIDGAIGLTALYFFNKLSKSK